MQVGIVALKIVGNTVYLTIMQPVRSLWLAGKLWHQKGSSHHAAALAYFLPFALVPLLILSITIVGLFIDETLFTNMLNTWGAVISPEFRDVLNTAIRTYNTDPSILGIPFPASIFFILMVILTINNFAQGLRHIWGASQYGWLQLVKMIIRSFLFLFFVQLFFITILLIQLAASKIPNDISTYLFEQVASFVAVAVTISLSYKTLSYKSPSYQACLAGGIIVAFIFSFIQSIINTWLQISPIDNLYGAAGLLLAFLVWIYIITAILYYGAAYAYVYDNTDWKK